MYAKSNFDKFLKIGKSYHVYEKNKLNTHDFYYKGKFRVLEVFPHFILCEHERYKYKESFPKHASLTRFTDNKY